MTVYMTVLLEYPDLSHSAYQTLRKAGHKSLTGTWPSLLLHCLMVITMKVNKIITPLFLTSYKN